MAQAKSNVAIIGGGIMGGDIAAVFAAGDWIVHVVDAAEKARATLSARVAGALGKIGASAEKTVNVKAYPALEPLPWQDIELVVEAVTEDLAIKQKLFSDLEKFARADIPLASNTSTLPIGEIGRHLKTRSRVISLHYFMPAHMVPLVEIIPAQYTDRAVGEWLEKNQRSLGKAPVLVKKEMPGGIGNRLQHALMREALWLLAEDATTPEGIDTAVRYGFGFRFLACGPMMQKEMSGWDIILNGGTSIYPTLHNESAPPQFLKDMVAQGHTGMKARHGLWPWTDDEIAKQKARIEKTLEAALAILKADKGK
jgi:3-hydroxybutyryl-CoA dehydrogenase